MATKTKTSKRRGKRKLPAGIVEVVSSSTGETRYRFWLAAGGNGAKRWGPTVETLEEAVRLRYAAQKVAESLPARLLTFGEAVELERKRITRVCRPGTLRWFNAQARVLLRYFGPGKPVASITPADLEGFIAQRLAGVRAPKGSPNPWKEAPVSACSVLHYKRALRGILARCGDSLQKNPLKALPTSAWPRERSKQTDYFEAEEIADLLQKIRTSGTETADHDHDLIALLAMTGLRRGELARLRVADVDLDRGTLTVDGKTDRQVVTYSTAARPVLVRMLERATGPMLVQGAEDGIARVFRRWRARLKEPRLHAHALRHSFATALVRAGHDLATVQRHTRHASLAMLGRYMHAAQDDKAVLDSIDLGLDGPKKAKRRLRKVE